MIIKMEQTIFTTEIIVGACRVADSAISKNTFFAVMRTNSGYEREESEEPRIVR